MNKIPFQNQINPHTYLWACPAQQSKWKLTVGGHNQVNPDSFPAMGTSRALQFTARLPSHGAEAENRETTVEPIHGCCTDWKLFILKGLETVSVGTVVQQEALVKKMKRKGMGLLSRRTSILTPASMHYAVFTRYFGWQMQMFCNVC